MKIREAIVLLIGPAAILVYCGFYAYKYENAFMFLAGAAITIAVIYMVWSHLREAQRTPN